MNDLQNKVVVITGAGSGIGLATAGAFAAAGARLHLVDIDAERLEVAAEQLSCSAPSVVTHLVDCADGAAVEQLAESVYERDGRVDVLHNNAGVCVGGPVEQVALSDWQWIVGVNLWGVIHGVHAFVPRMIRQGGGGHLVNTASMAGLVGLPMVVPYSTTKFAIVGLSEALDAELCAHGIRVTVVCPGAVRTELMRDGRLRLPGKWADRIQRAFVRHSASPERLADQIVAAVRRERSMVISAGHMLPLWLLKRSSLSLYQRTARTLTTLALRARPKR